MIVLRVGQVMDLITYGESNRMVSATAMNSESSRSHSVFCIELHQKLRDGFVKVKCMLLSPCLSHHCLLVSYCHTTVSLCVASRYLLHCSAHNSLPTDL